MRKILRFIKRFISKIICYPLKVTNKIVFINFNGKGYGDNPKYLAEEIIKQNKPYDLVWVVKDLNEKMPKEIRKVKYNSLQEFKELASAKMIITNVKNELVFIKKKNQIVIQTWHGSFSPKMLEKDAIDNLPVDYIRESKKNSAQTDYFISNSKMQSNEYRNAFWCTSEILEFGYPRNDIFFEKNINKKIREIKNYLGLDGKKVILYAPTFRNNWSLEPFDVDCEKLINNFTDEYILLIRMHPNVKNYEKHFKFNDRIIDVTNYPDTQELLLITNYLITDYSSTMFDISIINKPVFLYASDIEEYKKSRGLKKMYYELPFTFSKNTDELINNIKNYDEKKYKKNLPKLKELYYTFDKGQSSKKIIEYLFDKKGSEK